MMHGQTKIKFSKGTVLHKFESLLHISPYSQLLVYSDLPILHVTRTISVVSEMQTVTTSAFCVHIAQ